MYVSNSVAQRCIYRAGLCLLQSGCTNVPAPPHSAIAMEEAFDGLMDVQPDYDG